MRLKTWQNSDILTLAIKKIVQGLDVKNNIISCSFVKLIDFGGKVSVTEKDIETIILAHGSVETSCEKPFLEGLRKAVLAGYGDGNVNIIDMVEQTVRLLEDNPLYNAGFGSVLNHDGEVEMDASIMDGLTGRCGAVAAIKNVKNPVSVARKVMEMTSHVLIAGDGALKFARNMDFDYFDPIIDTQRESWVTARNLQKSGQDLEFSAFTGLPTSCDTVGCVVLHRDGVAAGSSTGGTFLKLPGRVGDSPVIGGGIFASPCGAAVCTGRGEAFIEMAGAMRAVSLLEQGLTPEQSGKEIIARIEAKKAVGGILIVNIKGEAAAVHNSSSFPVALMMNGRLVENFKTVKI